ncbi:hypothetical protein ZIOFF_061210 [Zingiber officinale]|uniref:Uncharacterized protein n=1 Tax=Zingiber officinale TaxID=94328 RepID=A0A8J5KED0_ZINOF|nr:hypothetical protein ZIOFF_061210 [Zingiber officinale]
MGRKKEGEKPTVEELQGLNDDKLHEVTDAELHELTNEEERLVDMQKNKRGPTLMGKLTVAARWSKKAKIDYDNMGRLAYNANGRALQSYIGVKDEEAWMEASLISILSRFLYNLFYFFSYYLFPYRLVVIHLPSFFLLDYVHVVAIAIFLALEFSFYVFSFPFIGKKLAISICGNGALHSSSTYANWICHKTSLGEVSNEVVFMLSRVSQQLRFYTSDAMVFNGMELEDTCTRLELQLEFTGVLYT